KGERREHMAPARDVDLAQALQRDWRCCMKQREDKIKSQRSIKVTNGQVRSGPRTEKNEGGHSGHCLHNDELAFERRKLEHPNIYNKQIAEQQHRSLRDRLKREKVKGRAHRGCSEAKRAGEQLVVHFSGALCQGYTGEKQTLKTGKHRHHNKDLLAREIFFRNKERRHPGELH